MPTQKSGKSSQKPKSVKAIRVNEPHSQIVDDTYQYLENELQQIRQCSGMYIGSGGLNGAIHLLNEIVANCIDECTNPSSMGNTIWVTFLEKDCKFIIEDNGRGIPLDILFDVISKKHYSTKFSRDFNHYSGGQNGVGTTIAAALSDLYLVRSSRDGQSRTVFMQNDQLNDDGYAKIKEGKSGLYTEFVPSQKWLGNFKITVEDVDDYLRRLSYIMPQGVTIRYLSINKKGKEVSKTIKHLGIAADVEYLSQNLEFNPVVISVPEIVIEADDADNQYFKLEFAFSYDRTLDESITDSYCNYLHTKEGGTHEQVVIQAISSFFVRQAKALDPNAKYEVVSDDCKKGLIAVINCSHSSPMFEGQHKSKVDQKNIITHGRAPIMTELTTYFETNNGLLRKIIQYLRMIAKIRLDAHKMKVATIKKATTFLDDADLHMFRPVSDRNYTGYKELIISEGDSSISAIEAARNVVCQAVFGIRGVVSNTYNMPVSKIATNDIFKSLVSVLGCGIGKDFDVNKLRYDAIIMATDADVDGAFIVSLLCVLFAQHMPEIITGGHLYRVVPPLYRLNAKESKAFGLATEYLFDKADYFHLLHKIIANNLDICVIWPHSETDLIKGTGEVVELSKKEKIAMLDATSNYLDELHTLQKRAYCNADILEAVCYFKVMTSASENPQKKFEALMKKKFPELRYDPDLQSIIGAYNGQNVSLIVDDIFTKMSSRMMKAIAEGPAYYVLVKNKNAKKSDPKADDWDLMTYGQLLEMCDKTFRIDIEQRYKGIGESDASMVFASMMNPKTRKLVRITMDDIPAAMETIKLLHGPGEDMRAARRKLLAEADITLQDIDN